MGPSKQYKSTRSIENYMQVSSVKFYSATFKIGDKTCIQKKTIISFSSYMSNAIANYQTTDSVASLNTAEKTFK